MKRLALWFWDCTKSSVVVGVAIRVVTTKREELLTRSELTILCMEWAYCNSSKRSASTVGERETWNGFNSLNHIVIWTWNSLRNSKEFGYWWFIDSVGGISPEAEAPHAINRHSVNILLSVIYSFPIIYYCIYTMFWKNFIFTDEMFLFFLV